MSDSATLGASFQIDITNLKAGLSQANRLIKESNSEFKAAAAGMGDWTTTQEGLTKKLKNLNTVADLQQKKVSALQKEYDNLIADGLDPASSAAVKLRTDINNEKAALSQTQSQIKKYSSALDDMKSSTTENISSSQKLKDEISDQSKKLEDLKSKYSDVVLDSGKYSKEARSLKKEIQNLNSEINENKKKLSDSEIALKDTGNAAKDSGDGFTVAKGAISNFIGNGLSALVGAAKNAISSLAGLASETREFRQDLNTLTTAYGEANFSAETATDTWKNLYAIFGEDDRAVEAANNIARMSESQKDLDNWVRITTGAWGTYQDALPVESLAEAAGETAKTGTVTGTLADALNWSSDAAKMFSKYMGGDVVTAEDAFNVALSKCSNEQERQALITDTLLALYGDAADSYNESASSIIEANKATADYNLTMADLGEKIEPVTTSVKNGFNDILDKILELTDNVDFSGFAASVDEGFQDFIDNVLPNIISGIQWIIDNKETVGAIAGVITGIAVAIGVLNGVLAIQSAIMAANPTTWIVMAIVAAIAALIAIIVVCVKHWDDIKAAGENAINKIKEVWNDVSEWFSEKVEGIKDAFSGIADWFREKFNTARQNVENTFSSIGAWFSGIGEKIKSVFNSIPNFFREKFSEAKQKVIDVFNPIVEFFSGIFDKIKAKFTSIGTKIGDAIGGAFKTAINAVISTVEKGINVIPNSINKMTSVINKLPGVSIGKIPTVSLPRLAKGGVVKSATTALIGEDGAEAVVPLEKNKQWIKQVAKELANETKPSVVVNQTNNYSQAHSRFELFRSKQQTAAAVRQAMAGSVKA